LHTQYLLAAMFEGGIPMAPATVETPELEQKPTVGDRVVDACRQAAHLSREARLLKSVAKNAVEDGVYAAKRAIESIQRRVEHVEDLRDEAIHRVKRQPLRAVGAVFGVGLALGFAVGWIARRPARHE
jgi:ElaB/YqjD/DUF883 family membrane-anchored ribosome-binding protein